MTDREEYRPGFPTEPAKIQAEIEIYKGLALASRKGRCFLDAEAYQSYADFLTDRLNGIERCHTCGHKLRKK